MHIRVITLYIFLFTTHAFACGIYQVNGMVRGDKSGNKVVVAEKSKSETTLTTNHREEFKLLPYLNLPVTLSVLILKPFDGTQAEVEKIQSIELRAADPHKINDSKMSLTQEMKCEKK